MRMDVACQRIAACNQNDKAPFLVNVQLGEAWFQGLGLMFLKHSGWDSVQVEKSSFPCVGKS